MAGALRKDWQAAKSVSLETFKKEHPALQGHLDGGKPYPLKFKQDLGPALDDWEKAKSPADKAKHKKKATDVIESYKGEIAKAVMAGDMKASSNGSAWFLVEILKKIERSL
jgi:hypothetical protein